MLGSRLIDQDFMNFITIQSSASTAYAMIFFYKRILITVMKYSCQFKDYRIIYGFYYIQSASFTQTSSNNWMQGIYNVLVLSSEIWIPSWFMIEEIFGKMKINNLQKLKDSGWVTSNSKFTSLKSKGQIVLVFISMPQVFLVSNCDQTMNCVPHLLDYNWDLNTIASDIRSMRRMYKPYRRSGELPASHARTRDSVSSCRLELEDLPLQYAFHLCEMVLPLPLTLVVPLAWCRHLSSKLCLKAQSQSELIVSTKLASKQRSSLTCVETTHGNREPGYTRQAGMGCKQTCRLRFQIYLSMRTLRQ